MTRPIPFNNKISEKSKDFIKKCLKVKEDDRMSWEEAFNHPIMDENLNTLRYKLEEQTIRNKF